MHSHSPHQPDAPLTRAAAATYLGYTAKTVSRHLATGELNTFEGPGAPRVSANHVRELVMRELANRELAALLPEVIQLNPDNHPNTGHSKVKVAVDGEDATRDEQGEVLRLKSALGALQQAHRVLTDQLSVHLG